MKFCLLSLSRHAFCNNQFCSGSPLFLLRDKWNTWTSYFKKANHTSKIKVYMCTWVTPNEISPYLFFVAPCFLQQSILFRLSIVPIKISKKHMNMDGISKKLNIIHLNSKCMCARVIPNEIFPSLFLGRAMLSATTNFALALHCSC